MFPDIQNSIAFFESFQTSIACLADKFSNDMKMSAEH